MAPGQWFLILHSPWLLLISQCYGPYVGSPGWGHCASDMRDRERQDPGLAGERCSEDGGALQPDHGSGHPLPVDRLFLSCPGGPRKVLRSPRAILCSDSAGSALYKLRQEPAIWVGFLQGSVLLQR